MEKKLSRSIEVVCLQRWKALLPLWALQNRSDKDLPEMPVVCFGEGWQTRCYVIITFSSTFL